MSQQLSLLNIEGTDVVFGDLQMVPLAGGLLWVRPVYVQPTVTDTRESQPTIELVLVSQNKNAAFGSSLSGAMAKLFPGFDGNIGDVVGDTPPSTTATARSRRRRPTRRRPNCSTRPRPCSREADQALDDHDLATYQAQGRTGACAGAASPRRARGRDSCGQSRLTSVVRAGPA